MSWLTRLLGKSHAGDASLQQALAELPPCPPPAQLALADTRFVVVDTESTGLDVQKDKLLSIGAVAIEGGRLRVGDQFEAVLAHADADTRPTVLLHGIGADAVRAGQAPAEALLAFYRWSGPCVFIAFHAGFDRALTERSLRDVGGSVPQRSWLDLAVALPALYPARRDKRRSLDDWTSAFGLYNPGRHQAAADAFVTAELALAMLAVARRNGLHSVADLQRVMQDYQRLQQLHPR